MKNFFIPIFLFVAVFISCGQQQDEDEPVTDAELIFQSGFEPDSRVVPRGNDADIIGVDQAFNEENDWVEDLDNHPEVGNFNLQYQGGDLTQRFAKIIPEPGNPENRVLHFWLNEPNVGGKKGRIQANIYGSKGWKEFYQSVRVFLHEDFNTVKTYPDEIHWCTIAEFWNNITWRQNVPYGFRITLGIGKPEKGNSELYFILDGQDCELFEDGSQKYTTLWSEINKNIKVPVDKWFTMEYYYKEGDADNGRFYLAIQPDGEEKQVVFDVNRYTHNSEEPSPDGVSDFNPLKLYTSKNLIDYMNDNEKTLQIYWDDFKLWKNKQPE